jgi:hypothetical protein
MSQDKTPSQGNRIDDWDKVYAVFNDYMSDIEFMPKDQVDDQINYVYKAMLWVNNQIKFWRLQGGSNEPRQGE